MLVGNNIALVIYGILMAQIIGDNLVGWIYNKSFFDGLVQTIISTLIILVTGEFLPKTLFKINPNLYVNVCAIPYFSVILFFILFLNCLRIILPLSASVRNEDKQRSFGKGFR